MQKIGDFAKKDSSEKATTEKKAEVPKKKETVSKKQTAPEKDPEEKVPMEKGEGRDFSKRRVASVERRVSEITEQDIRVSVIGTVIDSKEDRIVIDDGTGRIEASFGSPVNISDKTVRIFGRVMPIDGGVEISGEIIQGMDGLDMDMLGRVKELESGK